MGTSPLFFRGEEGKGKKKRFNFVALLYLSYSGGGDEVYFFQNPSPTDKKRNIASFLRKKEKEGFPPLLQKGRNGNSF